MTSTPRFHTCATSAPSGVQLADSGASYIPRGMDVTPPLAPSATNPSPTSKPADVEAFLDRISSEHRRFIGALNEANRELTTDGQLIRVASIQTRLAQEFLDAQRAILRRRAETDVVVADIAAHADQESASIMSAARSRARIAAGDLPLPPPALGSLAAPLGRPVRPASPFDPVVSGDATESLARLIDGAFEPAEPDGVAARRQLRELLDAWWEAEKHEAKAAADDASARAAMLVHTAKIEAAEIARFGPPTAPPQTPTACSHPLPASLPSPIVSALDHTDHEHLDDVLAHLLDELDDGSAPELPEARAGVGDTGGFPPPTLPPARPAPAPSDSLNDRSAAPQEAFDRFWGGFGGTRTHRWTFPQFLLPAVAVVSVLALVLAVIG